MAANRTVDIPQATSLRYLLSKFNDNKIFIESGTCRGGSMAVALRCNYTRYFGFETDYNNFRASITFLKEEIRQNKVQLFNESSGSNEFSSLINTLEEPITFWLDGHANGPGGVIGEDYPLLRELKYISEHKIKTHAILIDDVRLFERFGTTTKEIEKLIKSINRKYKIRYTSIRQCFPGDVLVAFVGKIN